MFPPCLEAGRGVAGFVVFGWYVKTGITIHCKVRPVTTRVRPSVTELPGLTSDSVLRRTAGGESSRIVSDLNQRDSRV